MEAELSADVIWSLRALSQNANAQRELYPDFAVVADELVLDFDEAYTKYKENSPAQQVDLDELDSHIASKSGILEYWTDEALNQSVFWNEIRQRAKEALRARDLSTFAPHTSADTYISEGEVWTSGRNVEKPEKDAQVSFLSKLLGRFR